MKDSNDDILEQLIAIKKRMSAVQLIISNIELFPNLCFIKFPLRDGDYWENVGVGKKKSGSVPYIDLPTDLGIKEAVVAILTKEYDQLKAKLESFKISK